METSRAKASWRSRLWSAFGVVLSIGLVAAITLQLGGAATGVLRTIHRLPLGVWPVLALFYLVQPLSDFMVFRRLWNLPFAGFPALLRKNVINEVVLGYSGEAYLYVWARRASNAALAPFAAIKDANIVSALLGNLFTLGLVAICATQLRDLELDRRLGPALWSGLIPVAISVGLLAFGRRVFSLRLGQLLFVAATCGIRLVAASALTVLIWHLALPDVALGMWFVLLAVRYLVSRIPFLSNKDLVFGNLVLLLLGPNAEIAVLLAALALITLMLHLIVIAGLGAADLGRGLVRAFSGRGVASPAVADGVHD